MGEAVGDTTRPLPGTLACRPSPFKGDFSFAISHCSAATTARQADYRCFADFGSLRE
jgi:hypothetical protein